MRPLMKMLADAGQKIITATLTHKPWNGQTEDYFDTMVTWMKRADGTWAFDYTKMCIRDSIQVARPHYEQLKNAIHYGNRFTYLGGAPNLQPTYIHAAEMRAIYRLSLIHIRCV